MDGGGSGTSGRSAAAASVTRARVTKLREAGVALAARADAQKAMPLQLLEALSGTQLRREYVQTSGGGVPWSVNEREPWYLAQRDRTRSHGIARDRTRSHEIARFSCEPLGAACMHVLITAPSPPHRYLAHERARFSCVECSGDVVPEKDLLGCWPLWTQVGSSDCL